MLKPLLKKQFLETASFFFLNNKDGKRRSKAAFVGFAALMLYAVAAMVMMFYVLADALCAPLAQNGLAWVYFAFMGTLATGFSCIGSIFAAKSKLYEAKDNDLLLSMPLSPRAVLFSRMVGLYALAFLFEALVFLPAVVCYFVTVGFSILPALFILLTTFILPLGSLAISCLLGWAVALITARLRAKNLFTVVFFLLFLVVYFFAYSKLNEYLGYIIANGEAVGAKIKTVLFPFWQMGLGATGRPLGFLAFAGIFLAAFGLVYLLLTKTFLRLVTMKRGGAKSKYREKTHKQKSAFGALLHRESLRFFKNPMIFLNASLGSVFCVLLIVFACVNPDMIGGFAALKEHRGLIALALTAIVCGVSSMNFVTASSVSLEGETIWLLQSSPVRTRDIFKAKIALHALVTAVPALIAAIALAALLKLGVWLALMVCVVSVAFVVFCAMSGLAINLKMPNLHWTSETAAVKQSMSSVVAMFANIGALAAFIIGYVTFGKYLPAAGYAAICLVAIAAGGVALAFWLERRGTKIFEDLQP